MVQMNVIVYFGCTTWGAAISTTATDAAIRSAENSDQALAEAANFGEWSLNFEVERRATTPTSAADGLTATVVSRVL